MSMSTPNEPYRKGLADSLLRLGLADASQEVLAGELLSSALDLIKRMSELEPAE